MTIYRVTLDETFKGTTFEFIDYGEAMGFIAQAIENGISIGGDSLGARIDRIDIDNNGGAE